MWYYLKLQNKNIMKINYDETGLHVHDKEIMESGAPCYEIYEPDLLPFCMRDHNLEENEKKLPSPCHTFDLFWRFLRSRSLNSGRAGFKRLSGQFDIPDALCDYIWFNAYVNTMYALSASDDYWITSDPTEKWENINPRIHDIDLRISKLALKIPAYFPRYDLKKIITPEYSGQGYGLRRWIKKDGKLTLRKYNYRDNFNVFYPVVNTLVETSKFLDTTTIEHVKYEKAEDNLSDLKLHQDTLANKSLHLWDLKDCCDCECVATDEYSYVSLAEMFIYCEINNLNYTETIMAIDEENIYKQCIIDYLLGNERWETDIGFMMNNKTGKLEKCAPMFGYSHLCAEEDTFFPFFDQQKIEKSKIKKYLSRCGIKQEELDHNEFAKKRLQKLCAFLLDPNSQEIE